MVLPAVLAGLGLTEAVWIAIMGIIRLIAWITGIVFIASYTRDVVIKVKEADIVADQNSCVEAVLARTDLTADQKRALAEDCISKPAIDWQTTALYAIGILAGAYILGQILNRGKQ